MPHRGRHGTGLGRSRGRGVRAGGRARPSLARSTGSRRGRGAGGSREVVRVEGAALVLDALCAVGLASGIANVGGVALRVGLLTDKLGWGAEIGFMLAEAGSVRSTAKGVRHKK